MAAGNIYIAHVNGDPHQVHSGATTLDSWVIVNRSRNIGYLLVWNLASGDVTPGTTPPTHIIPVADKSEFSPKTSISYGTALSVGFFNDRDGTLPADSDVLLEYTT